MLVNLIAVGLMVLVIVGWILLALWLINREPAPKAAPQIVKADPQSVIVASWYELDRARRSTDRLLTRASDMLA